jgi:hypothetical protein
MSVRAADRRVAGMGVETAWRDGEWEQGRPAPRRSWFVGAITRSSGLLARLSSGSRTGTSVGRGAITPTMFAFVVLRLRLLPFRTMMLLLLQRVHLHHVLSAPCSCLAGTNACPSSDMMPGQNQQQPLRIWEKRPRKAHA